MQPRRMLVLLPVLFLIGLALAGCGAETQAPTEPTPPPATVCPPAAVCPEPVICPEPSECPSSVAAPFESQWLSSPHADAAAEAFVHWNEDDPAEVPVDCARCHSTYGYQDFLGADGSPAGIVDQAAAIGSVITCVACHNDATLTLTNVVFPSGLEVTGLGDEARCMQCHQGRASGATVDASIEKAGLTDMDTVSADLRFTNIHYFAASATQYGTWAMGGYQYADMAYDVKFDHAGGLDTCIDCHQPHTLEVRIERCGECHEGVTTVDDLKNVRTMGSQVDYDGDSDTEEGVYYEIEGLQAMLTEAMQAYSKQVTGSAIAYSADAYPYFLIDTNANGTADEAEATRENGYASFTGRLAKAAYNLHLSVKDPGAFAHGGKYVIELLYDSIADLNSVLTSPVDLTSAHRIDAGHFASSEMPWRDFDGGMVRATCARCHSPSGLPTYLANGVNIAAEPGSSLACTTCHDETTEDFAPRVVETVRFPSGAVLDTGNPSSNICISCHQGRESGLSVSKAVEGFGDDEVIPDRSFINIHYFAAGATFLASEAQGGYQYAGEEYAGKREHVQGAETCVDCHDPHGLAIDEEFCNTCHKVDDLEAIRTTDVDYDGDGDAKEGLAAEVATMEEALYAAMQDYASTVLEAPIAYSSDEHPYYFSDLNANGLADPDEMVRDNAYANWTPRLLKAAYNYQVVHKDPGAFAHNGVYILQILYDSLADLSNQVTVDMTAMVRP